MELKKVKITSWSGEETAELHIPETCSDDFKASIIGFLSELDDHDAIYKCRKEIWKIENWDRFCRDNL